MEKFSSRPYRVRRLQTSLEAAERVRELREGYRRWAKDKPAVVSRKKGVEISASLVKLVINPLKRKGRI